MSGTSVTRRINAPAEVVFDVFTNAMRYPEYTPIRRVEMEREGEGALDGTGAIRALHTVGPPVRELVTGYEPSKRFAFEVISGGPVRSYAGELTFETEGDGEGTIVTYAIELTPLVPGTGFATASAFRGAVEVLMRLAAREADRRASA